MTSDNSGHDPDPFGPDDVPTRRRDARERSIEVLYEAEMKRISGVDVIAEMLLPPDPLVAELVSGVEDHLVDLDEQITAALDRSWTMARLSVLDRLILRQAAFELMHRSQVPTAVVLNEAVELAKNWGGPDAGRFVNGVLSAVARNTRD